MRWTTTTGTTHRSRHGLALPRLTKLLVALVVAAAAFAGGVFAQRHWGTTSSGGSCDGCGRFLRHGGASAAATGGTSGTGGGAAGGFAAATIGQVAYLKGTTLYVTDTSGNTVKVTVPKGTPVTKSVTTSLKGVRPGDTVVIRGSQGKNGTVSATSISVGGATGQRAVRRRIRRFRRSIRLRRLRRTNRLRRLCRRLDEVKASYQRLWSWRRGLV